MIHIDLDDSGLQQRTENFEKAPEKFLAALWQANVTSAARLLGRIKGSLRDGSVGLRVRTGKLSRNWSMKTPEILSDGKGWLGGIGTNTDYAPYHEFGFHGEESVRAHTRRASRTKKASAWGARGKDVFGRRASKATFGVRAHERRVNYAGHPYLRPAAVALTPTIRADHLEALGKVKLDG